MMALGPWADFKNEYFEKSPRSPTLYTQGSDQRITFTVYAISRDLALEPGQPKQELWQAMNRSIVSSGELNGTY